MARIYGKRFDGKVFEIQNWAKSKSGDALVMQPLSNTQTIGRSIVCVPRAAQIARFGVNYIPARYTPTSHARESGNQANSVF